MRAENQWELSAGSPTMQLAHGIISLAYFFLPPLLPMYEKSFHTGASLLSIGGKPVSISTASIYYNKCFLLSFQKRTIFSDGYCLRGQTWRIESTSKTEMDALSCTLWHLPVTIPGNAVNAIPFSLFLLLCCFFFLMEKWRMAENFRPQCLLLHTRKKMRKPCYLNIIT